MAFLQEMTFLNLLFQKRKDAIQPGGIFSFLVHEVFE